MPRRAWAFAIIGALLPAACAGPPSPVCDDPDVLNFLAQELTSQDPYAVIIPQSVAEIRTTETNPVTCSVYVQSVFYNYPQYGTAPEIRLIPRTYYVRALSHGFEVKLVNHGP